MRSDNMPREVDIVDRLRGVHAGTPLEVACELDDLCEEAARSRRRLQEEADQLEKRLEDDVDYWRRQVLGLREEVAELRNEVTIRVGIDVELQALRAKIEAAPVRVVEEHHIDGRFFEYLRLEWPLGAGPLPSIIGKRVRLVVEEQ